MKNRQIAALATLALIVIAATSGAFFVQGQTPEGSAGLVNVADQAEHQVKSLIDLVYANETALQVIDDFGLLDELEGNVSLYESGVEILALAQDALKASDYEGAASYAKQALSIFREVFSSIHIILCEAELQKGTLVDYLGLLESMTRSLEKISKLRTVLAEDASDALALLDQAETYLGIDLARQLLLEGKVSEVVANLSKANQLISQVYEFLKEQAVQFNGWRIESYCERLRQRVMERFMYGSQQGINADDYLVPLGYQSENQFMETLQNMTQAALGQSGDIQSAIQELETMEQMVQTMNQALETEIGRRQGGSGGAGSGTGVGGTGQGYGGNN